MAGKTLSEKMTLILSTVSIFMFGTWAAIQIDQIRHLWNRVIDQQTPVTSWMIVHDLIVPDHRARENPLVQFHRTIFRDVFGGWGVEAHDRDGQQYCAASSRGGAVYTVSEAGRKLIPFQAYTGGCNLPPGEYRLSVLIQLSAGGDVVKTISFQSNWFTVLP